MSVGVLKPRENDGIPTPRRMATRTVLLADFALTALLFLVFFGASFLKLAYGWGKDPSYSHGFLVPIISLALAIRAYRRAGPPIAGDVRLGCLAMMAGCLLHLILTLINNPPLDFLAVGLVLWGMAVSLGSVAWARDFLFPIGFLFFMFPLPATWTNFAALWLQDWVARISAVLLDPFVVCYRHGNSLHLAGVREPLVVAAECSGLRQIVAFTALGVLAGGLTRTTTTFRVLLVLAAVPAAILANVARILLMAAGSVWFGTQWMGGWLHDAPAVLTLPLGLALLALAGWGISRVIERRETRPLHIAPGLPGNHSHPQQAGGYVLWCAPACLAVAVLAQFGLAWHLRGSEISPYPDLASPFATLPREIDGPTRTWHGQDAGNLDEFRAKLPYTADDLLYRWYAATPNGAPLSLYLVYSRSGDDRKHHPEICIRDASGASEDLDARRQIALDPEGERQVMRFRFRTGSSQFTTVYYWHYALEAAPRKGQSFLQALHQRQNHPVPSLTVQVSLSAGPEKLQAVEKEFLVAVDSALRKGCLPSTARMGCQRLPIALVRD